MTCYNREKYIAEAIESVLSSTYTNFELIIVDDCSKDRTVEIAKHYESNDYRIKVYINEKNIGDYPNRNKAAGYANGKYLKYLDSDDLIYPNGLQILVEIMEKFPDAGYGLCSFPQVSNKIYPFQLSPKEAYYMHYFVSSLFHRAPLSSIINREVFNIVGGFSGKQHVGDFELWHKLSAKYPVVIIQDGIVWNREHEGQQMNDNRNDPLVPLKYLVLSENIFTNNISPLQPDENEICLRKNRNKQALYILYILKRKGWKSALRLYKNSNMKWNTFIKALVSK
jgi:glycosyltransferase involved in cell wall biosynthesis